MVGGWQELGRTAWHPPLEDLGVKVPVILVRYLRVHTGCYIVNSRFGQHNLSSREALTGP